MVLVESEPVAHGDGVVLDITALKSSPFASDNQAGADVICAVRLVGCQLVETLDRIFVLGWLFGSLREWSTLHHITVNPCCSWILAEKGARGFSFSLFEIDRHTVQAAGDNAFGNEHCIGWNSSGGKTMITEQFPYLVFEFSLPGNPRIG